MAGKVYFLLALGVLVTAATALPALSNDEAAEDIVNNADDNEGIVTSTELPYLRPTNIPPLMPKSCAERPPVNKWLMIPSPETCRKFIVCYAHWEQEMVCPGVLFFSYKEQRCEWPGKSGCDEPIRQDSVADAEAPTEEQSEAPTDESTEVPP